jgi:hypothetical protein
MIGPRKLLFHFRKEHFIGLSKIIMISVYGAEFDMVRGEEDSWDPVSPAVKTAALPPAPSCLIHSPALRKGVLTFPVSRLLVRRRQP